MDIPFRVAIATAAGAHRLRSLLFVRLVAEDGEGWGECAALAEGTSVDPALTEVEATVVGLGVPRLLVASECREGQVPSGPETPRLFGTSPVDRQMAAVFEMAVTDLELRAQGRSLAAGLGTEAGWASMPVGAVVGIPADGDLGAFRAAVDAAVGAGAARIRVKVRPGWSAEPVRAARADHPDLVLQADANGSFRLRDEDVAELQRLGDAGALCVEQPLPPADLVAHAELAGRLTLPICLDESLSSPQRVRDALRNGSCAMACLKPGRLGGLRAARVAHEACVEAGVPAFVGGFFEAGLGRAANLALAARLAQDASGLVSDLGDPTDYLAVDPCGYPAVRHGWVRVPEAAGVGNPPDSQALARHGVRRRWFPATYT